MSVLNIDKTPSLKPHTQVSKEEIHTLKSLHELSPNSVYYNCLRCTPTLMLAVRDSGSERNVIGGRLVCHPKQSVGVTPSTEIESASGTPPQAISLWKCDKDKRISSHTQRRFQSGTSIHLSISSQTHGRDNHTHAHTIQASGRLSAAASLL